MLTLTGTRLRWPSAVTTAAGTLMKCASLSDSSWPSKRSWGIIRNFRSNSRQFRTFSLSPPFASDDRAACPDGLLDGGNDGENAKVDRVDVRKPGAREPGRKGLQGQEVGPELGRPGRLRGGRCGRRSWHAGALPADRCAGVA